MPDKPYFCTTVAAALLQNTFLHLLAALNSLLQFGNIEPTFVELLDAASQALDWTETLSQSQAGS